MGGVKINDKTQVIADNDSPFEGLYAAGEVVVVFMAIIV